MTIYANQIISKARWAQQAEWIVKERAVPTLLNECRLLLTIQGCAHNSSHVCNLPQRILAEKSGIPLSSISAVAIQLERKGYIEIERWFANWACRTNKPPTYHGRVQYVLCWDASRYHEYVKNAPDKRKKIGIFTGKRGEGPDVPF